MINTDEKLWQLQKNIDVYWRDIRLLKQALVHSSYIYENRDFDGVSNERLEYLGDAVLELIVSQHYFSNFPQKTEGELTKMRALTVCEPSLAAVAKKLNLGSYLLMGRGEERSGGRARPSLLADAFEALLGAVYLDAGLEKARQVALNCLADILQDIVTGQVKRDSKTELQELLQQKNADPINYFIIDEKGPDHNKTFTAVVEYQGRRLGLGRGKSKKEAEQKAAGMALEKLEVDSH